MSADVEVRSAPTSGTDVPPFDLEHSSVSLPNRQAKHLYALAVLTRSNPSAHRLEWAGEVGEMAVNIRSTAQGGAPIIGNLAFVEEVCFVGQPGCELVSDSLRSAGRLSIVSLGGQQADIAVGVLSVVSPRRTIIFSVSDNGASLLYDSFSKNSLACSATTPIRPPLGTVFISRYVETGVVTLKELRAPNDPLSGREFELSLGEDMECTLSLSP